MSDVKTAIGYLETGNWEAAHLIVQDDESTEGCWAHGIVHLLEGDRSNAGYWYRRAGRGLPSESAVSDESVGLEIAALKARLG
jgi:hypothetical protein